MFAFRFARQFRVFRYEMLPVWPGRLQNKVRVAQPRFFGQGALINQPCTTLDGLTRQLHTIRQTTARGDFYGRAVKLFEFGENNGFVLEALVTNKLYRRVHFALGLDSGKPKRRLVRTTEEVIEA